VNERVSECELCEEREEIVAETIKSERNKARISAFSDILSCTGYLYIHALLLVLLFQRWLII
jgi:hypothetical protein